MKVPVDVGGLLGVWTTFWTLTFLKYEGDRRRRTEGVKPVDSGVGHHGRKPPIEVVSGVERYEKLEAGVPRNVLRGLVPAKRKSGG